MNQDSAWTYEHIFVCFLRRKEAVTERYKYHPLRCISPFLFEPKLVGKGESDLEGWWMSFGIMILFISSHYRRINELSFGVIMILL